MMAVDRTAYNREQKARARARRRTPVADANLSALADTIADKVADRILSALDLWTMQFSSSEAADTRDPVPGPYGARGTGPGIPGGPVRADTSADNVGDNGADTGPRLVRESLLAPDDERERIHAQNAEFLDRFRTAGPPTPERFRRDLE